MARYTVEGLTYSNAVKLIQGLKNVEIEAWITAGGVAANPSPEQVNQAQDIVRSFGSNLRAGFSTHQEEVLMKGGSYDVVEKATNNALSIIQEWK